MADREQPYDPYIPSEGAHGYAGASEEVNPKIAKIKSVGLLHLSPGRGLLAALQPVSTNSTLCQALSVVESIR